MPLKFKKYYNYYSSVLLEHSFNDIDIIIYLKMKNFEGFNVININILKR